MAQDVAAAKGMLQLNKIHFSRALNLLCPAEALPQLPGVGMCECRNMIRVEGKIHVLFKKMYLEIKFQLIEGNQGWE